MLDMTSYSLKEMDGIVQGRKMSAPILVTPPEGILMHELKTPDQRWSDFLVSLIQSESLERLYIYGCTFSHPDAFTHILLSAIARSKSLRLVDMDLDAEAPTNVDAIDTIIATNRTVNQLRIHFPNRSETIARACTRLRATAENNWALLELNIGWTPTRLDDRIITRRNNEMRWKNVHRIVLQHCLTLRPLRLPPYVLLWILDWLPPLHHRFQTEHLCNYDPNHGKKIRLIESIMRDRRDVPGRQ
jgi:hypothetical protein